ncbi:bifunctional folylpolyglutamate synthase/dihydrofolate synthase [bacterium]|nr:bifunctional folylpolyglutamate synthase/dihydrofolate synthase [bacterium]
MYQRQGAVAFKKDLKNTFALCHALDDPQLKFKSIHIAGTNGKGSTAHILGAIYRKNGYKTGLYTSPHLVDFRERIKIDGKMISKRDVVQFVKKLKSDIERIQPSFFEMTVAMAYDYFAKEEVDIAIIETGLGGRLDSTNVIIPELSVITSISRDHTEMLGEEIEEIAFEKAGIIKNSVSVITGLIPEEAEQVIQNVAHTRQSLYYNAIRIPHRFTKEGLVETDLLGNYQQLNIKTALVAVDALQHILPTYDDHNLKALKSVVELSGLQGRWQIYQKKPLVILDVAHNPEGLALAMEELDRIEGIKLMIMGFVKEKKLLEILPILPKDAQYFLAKPDIPRGMEAKEAAGLFAEAGIKAKACKNIKEAINAAEKAAKKSSNDSVFFIGGSNFIVADFLTLKPKSIG